jgi:hypothetical protein
MGDHYDEPTTRVLLALLHLHALNGRATVREVASGAGLCLPVAHKRLQWLRRDGLIAWDEGSQGTLRPLVSEVVG